MWVFLFHAQYGMDLPVLKLGYLGVDRAGSGKLDSGLKWNFGLNAA
jgi:hypothetical protein